MASIDKLIKSLDALNVVHITTEKPTEPFAASRLLKRDSPLSRKDKLSHCNTIADVITSPAISAIADFQKLLGISIETLLYYCDDKDPDVRIKASECLNRVIKCLSQSQGPKILLELYREVKKNSSSRTLRAGLSRFADLCHLIRPAKRRPYFSNLLPCLMKIIQRTGEEAVQETLSSALVKLMPVFGKFATDPEVSGLLKALMANLQHPVASIRRLAAANVCSVIQSSNKPAYFVSWLVNLLLQAFTAIRREQPPITTTTTADADNYSITIAGIFLAFKSIIPLLNEIPDDSSPAAGVHAASRSKSYLSPNDRQILIDNLVHMCELLLSSIRNESDHLVIVSALDALAQLLKSPPKLLLPVIMSPSGIGRSRIGDQVTGSVAASPTGSQRRLRGSSTSSFNFSSESVLEDDDQVVISNELHTLHAPARTPTKLSPSSFSESTSITEGPDEVSDAELDVEMDDSASEVSGTHNDVSARKNGSRFANNVMKLTFVEDDNILSSPDQIIPSPTLTSHSTPFSGRTGNLGSISDECCSLEYCARLVAWQFLLTGVKKGLRSDAEIRISVKSLALSCLSSIITLHPQAILLYLQKDETGSDKQKIWDVILFAGHADPQLRSQVLTLIASLISSVLNRFPSYTDFLLRHCSSSCYSEAPALDDLLENFYKAMKETGVSHPISIKSTLMALQSCFRSILNSEEALPHAIKLIRQAISLKDQNYWLIRVELVNFLSSLHFREIFYLEISQKTYPSLQHEIITDVLVPLICDEDHRIRNAAAGAIVKIVPNLFLPTNQLDGDVITSMASDFMHRRLTCFSSNRRSPLSFMHYLMPSEIFKDSSVDEEETINRNLKFIIEIMEQQLISNMDNKNSTIGVIGALEALSSNFCPMVWPEAWRDAGSFSRTRLLVSLLTSSANPIVIDIHVHERLVTHISHVLCGLAFGYMSDAVNEKLILTEHELENWSVLSADLPEVAQIMESFAGHLFKLVYILSCVASDVVPNFVSGPTAPSAKSSSSFYIPLTGGPLSPLRRMSKEGLDFGGKDGSRKSKELHVPHYLDSSLCKFYEVVRSAFLNQRSSSDFEPSKTSKFTSVVLAAVSQLLEFCTISFIGPKTEILIDQLNSLIPLDAQSCVSCVQQLLKSVFGTNMAVLCLPDVADQSMRPTSHRTTSSSSVHHHSSNRIRCNGLYQTIFSNPYSQYSQLYGAKWIASQTLPSHTYSRIEEQNNLKILSRKVFDRRIALLSEKTVITSPTVTADSSSTNIKAFLIGYIKMFEPVVIRALKMYTTTSDVQLQSEILNLLSILVKVRVNYCLLDSDFVFLDFVQRQFEFIEGGLIGETEQLIDSIFRFLTLLSYEKVDRKQILPVAKLIQLSDGLLASSQPAKRCVIPALRHLVHDLFLFRTAAKVESPKELETQREVVLATILKICLIPESIELLTLIVQSVRKDADEKWKKTSRTVMDVVMPHLMKQQLDIKDWSDLDVLHQLFEAVSPIVFRPADIILTALFSPPAENILHDQGAFSRWFANVLLLMRIMMMQTKEEVVLSRFQELRKTSIRIGCHHIICFEDSISTSTRQSSEANEKSSEEMFAEFFLQIFQLSVSQLSQHSWSTNEFLATQISHYLLYLTYLFQSGSFRRTSKAAAVVVRNSLSQNTDLTSFSMNNLNDVLLQIRSSQPVLLLQWLNVLLLLGFNDSPESGMGDVKSDENNRFFWSQHLQATRDQESESVIPAPLEMIRQGTIVLLCDFACESMSNAEQMTWLIINHIHEILLWSHELPVRDFIHTIHRNPASSALFIQSINSRCFLLKDPCLTQKLLNAVQFIHPTQSGPLVALLIEQVIVNADVLPFITLITAAQKLAIERIDMILKSESIEEMTSQLSVEDVARLLMLVNRKRHRPLFTSLEHLGRIIAQVDDVQIVPDSTCNQSPDAFGKEFFMRLTRQSCSHRNHSYESLNTIVQKLHQEDICHLLSRKEFVISCLEAGVCEEVSSSRRPSVELFADPAASRNRLLSSALVSLNARLEQMSIISIPVNAGKDSEDLESELSQLTAFSNAFAKLIRIGSNNRSSAESLKTMLSLISVYGDALTYAVREERADLESSCFTVLRAMAETEPLLTLVEDEQHSDVLFTIISALHSYVAKHFHLSPIDQPKRLADLYLVNPQWRKPHEACIRASQLVSFVSEGQPQGVFWEDIRLIVLSLCRIPVLNSFVMVPPEIWKTDSWHPNFCGNFGTTCPTVPSEELRDPEVLTQFTTRISLLGWRNRIQFEEFWMSLLGVISLLQSGDSGESFDESDVCVICTIAIKGITDLLLQVLLYPNAGNPVSSHYVSLKTEYIPQITHKKYGQKLVNLMETLSSHKQKLTGCTDSNNKKQIEYGHISVEFLKKMCKMSSSRSKSSPQSPVSPSSETSSTSSGSAPISAERVTSVLPTSIHESDMNRFLPYRDNLDIDLHSCMHFLLDLYNQLIVSKTTPPPLAAAIARSLLLVSDLFFEKSQYEWMLETFFQRYKHAVHAEDEVEIQFLVFGIIKCCSVLSVDAESATYEKMKMVIENGLKSPFLSSRIATIHGIKSYLLHCKDVLFKGKEGSLLTIVSEYLMKHLSDQSLPSSSDTEHACLMWDLSFSLIQNHMDDFADNEFGQKIFHLSVAFLGSDSRSGEVRKRICTGLEKLMLSETFAIREADLIVRTCMDRMRNLSPDDESAAFRLILTSIYVFGLSIGSESSADDSEPGSNEDIAAAMEKIAVMFDRLKFCGPNEASLMCSVLPALLVDFFPTQDILNKVIAEFLSNQQLYPQLIADVLFRVFEFLRIESKTDVIHDWVLLSLSIFAQLDPLPLAAWSLTCFLLSASSSIWAKAIFPCVRERFGKSDDVDGQLLSVAASHFFSDLAKDDDKDLLVRTIESVAIKDTPYQEASHFKRLVQTD